MKKILMISGVAALAGLLMFDSGCEWSGGGGANSFNTSQGAGISVNFSGVYRGNYPDGKVVETSSGAPISRFTLTQSGDSIQVIDNNGNRYSGNVGSPGLVFTPTTTSPTIPTGAEVMQAQMNFSGVDGSSGRAIQFVGIVHVVTITDVKSTTTTKNSGSSSASGTTNAASASGSQSTTTTQTSNDGTNKTVTITTTTPGFTLVVVQTYSATTGQLISETQNQTANNSQSQTQGQGESQTQVQTQTYSITEANAQYRLEGQWIEKDGNTSGVDALSPAGSGVVTRPIN